MTIRDMHLQLEHIRRESMAFDENPAMRLIQELAEVVEAILDRSVN